MVLAALSLLVGVTWYGLAVRYARGTPSDRLVIAGTGALAQVTATCTWRVMRRSAIVSPVTTTPTMTTPTVPMA